MSKRYLVMYNLVQRGGNKQAVSQHEDSKTQVPSGRRNNLFAFAPSSLRGFGLQLWRCLRPDILAIVAAVALLAGCGGQPQTLVPTNASPAPPKPTEQPATAAPALPTTPPSAVPGPTASTADTPAPATSAPAAPTALPASAVSDPAASTTFAATNGPAPALNRTLRAQTPPLQGEDVKAAQRRLLELRYTEVGEADGVFGQNTERAVRSFQSANTLDADGIIGPKTWERLFSAAAVAGPAIFPIVDGDSGYLLGGVQSGNWLGEQVVAAGLRGGERYRGYAFDRELGTAVGDKPESIGIPCDFTFAVTLTPALTAANALAVGGDWNALPRLPREGNTNDPAYQQVIADLLRAQGIAQPEVRITRVVQVDLEGDGTDETLISATHMIEDHPTSAIAAGDYSLVVALKDIAGKATTISLIGEYYPQAQEFAAPNEHTIVAVLDLNGDGRMEVVVDSVYYEGAATAAFAVDGDQAKEVLVTGCGV